MQKIEKQNKTRLFFIKSCQIRVQADWACNFLEENVKTSLRGSSHCTADDLLFTFVYFCLLFVYFCLLQPMASVCCRMAHPNLMMAIWAVAAMPTADGVCRETKNIAQMVSFAASKWIMKQIKRKVSKLKIKIGNLKLCFARIAF